MIHGSKKKKKKDKERNQKSVSGTQSLGKRSKPSKANDELKKSLDKDVTSGLKVEQEQTPKNDEQKVKEVKN